MENQEILNSYNAGKHGHWEPDSKNSVRCTCCNNQLHWEDYEFDRDAFMKNPDKVCSVCGATMDEVCAGDPSPIDQRAEVE